MEKSLKNSKLAYLVLTVILTAFIFPAWLWMGVMPHNGHITCPVAVMTGSSCLADSGEAMAWHHFDQWQVRTAAILIGIGFLVALAVRKQASLVKLNKEDYGLKKYGQVRNLEEKVKIRGTVLAAAINYLDLINNYPAATA